MQWTLVIAAMFALTASPALAEAPVLPGLAKVTGVAAGDVLNIRAMPDAGASILGELAPNAIGVEVLGQQDGWYRVNTVERSGWVNGRFLTHGANPFAGGATPVTLRCLGTEPFWSLARSGEALVLTTPEDQAGTRFGIRQTLGQHPDAPERTFLADGLTAIVAGGQCSDGMSDRAYALRATIILGAAPDAVQHGGCCTIAPPR